MSRCTLLVAALGVATVATACSSSAGTAAPDTPTPTTPTATRTATRTATATATTTPTRTGAASSEPSSAASSNGPSACLEPQLRASIDPRHIPGNGTAGSDGRHLHGVLVDFENKSSSTCTLVGYPGAAVVAASGKQVQQAKRTLRGDLGGVPSSQSGPKTVTLRPGAYAAALVEGIDTQDPGTAQAGCDGAKNPRILVTPPNTRTAVPFTVGWPQCYSFTVHPVQPLRTPPK